MSKFAFVAVIALGLCTYQTMGARASDDDEVAVRYFNGKCEDNNSRYAVEGQCDAYIECKKGVPEEKLCPDGLLFHGQASLFTYPCQYPIDVDCTHRGKTQPPQPTEDCPHQFGYYRLGDAAHCGQFKTCSQGAGFTLDCPEGLAFNKNTYQCDWPDLVPDCDVEAFLGFKCPAAPAGLGFPSARFHKSDDCQRFFLCSEGSTRLYRCGPGTAYSEDVGACDAAENVHGCEHLRIEHDDEEDAKKYNLKIKA